MTTEQLSEILTKKILEQLSSQIRLIVREEIFLNEQLKRKTIVQKPIIHTNGNSVKKPMVQQKRTIVETVPLKEVKHLHEKKKFSTGSSEVDNILNQDILLEDSLEEEFIQHNNSAFDIATNIRNKNLNNSQVKKSQNVEFNEEQVSFINEMVDAMEERAKDLKKDTTKAYSEFGNVNSLYKPEEISKLKLLT